MKAILVGYSLIGLGAGLAEIQRARCWRRPLLVAAYLLACLIAWPVFAWRAR